MVHRSSLWHATSLTPSGLDSSDFSLLCGICLAVHGPGHSHTVFPAIVTGSLSIFLVWRHSRTLALSPEGLSLFTAEKHQQPQPSCKWHSFKMIHLFSGVGGELMWRLGGQTPLLTKLYWWPGVIFFLKKIKKEFNVTSKILLKKI